MHTTQKFSTGSIVLASDGMSAWEEAKVLGYTEQLTTDQPMYHIQFCDAYHSTDGHYLCYEEDLRAL